MDFHVGNIQPNTSDDVLHLATCSCLEMFDEIAHEIVVGDDPDHALVVVAVMDDVVILQQEMFLRLDDLSCYRPIDGTDVHELLA